jgi:hypothetical protein
MRYLTVDGMLSGTGISNSVEGGCVDPLSLGISSALIADLGLWLKRYEEAHYMQFNDRHEVLALDAEGVALSRCLQNELPRSKIEYFSSGEMRKLTLNQEKNGPDSH